jgi:cytochrome c553
MTGVQYKVALPPDSTTGQGTDTSVLLGAVRNGGFDEARLDSSHPTRLLLSFGASTGQKFTALVPVASSGQPVTSAHLNLDGTTGGGVVSQGIAWGNGAAGSGAGPTVALTCASCHNPHGNGKFRILNPIPAPEATGGTFTPVAAPGVTVTDSALGTPDASTGAYPTRNYTVKPGAFATEVTGSATSGDYWRRCTPTWDNCTGANRGDKPNGLTTFRGEISAWCSTCHSRYLAGGGSASYESGPLIGDPIFAFRHTTNPSPECTQCHVGHGSNAGMDGTFSNSFPYPDDTALAPSFSGSSRLLKIDNRGTCQACHDPTDTITVDGTTNTTP